MWPSSWRSCARRQAPPVRGLRPARATGRQLSTAPSDLREVEPRGPARIPKITRRPTIAGRYVLTSHSRAGQNSAMKLWQYVAIAILAVAVGAGLVFGLSLKTG